MFLVYLFLRINIFINILYRIYWIEKEKKRINIEFSELVINLTVLLELYKTVVSQYI